MALSPMPSDIVRVFGSSGAGLSPSSSSRLSRHHVSNADLERPSPSPAPSAAIPMAIPNARDYVPPPQPPPRIIPELSNGQDVGWKYQNRDFDASRAASSLPSVKPGSSLLGGSLQRPALPRMHTTQLPLRESPKSSPFSLPLRRDVDMQDSESHTVSDGEQNCRPTLPR
jgi:hypothetical protein